MQSKKYNIISAAYFCFRYAPKAASIKLLIELLNGALAPLIVIIVASFINNAILYVNGEEVLLQLIIAIVLLASFYAYSQINQIIIRLADKSLENALKENLRLELIQKQANISYKYLENPETLDLISHVCNNAEAQVMAILASGLRLVRIAIQTIGVFLLLITYIWWIIPVFVLSTIPILFISSKSGHKIYDIFKNSTKLTRKHYYLSSVLVGRETAAERTLFGYADSINSKFSETHIRRSNLVTKAIAIEETSIQACSLILNVIVIIASFALLGSLSDGTLSHGMYVSLVGALIGISRLISGMLSPLVRDATEYAKYMQDFTRFFSLPEIDDIDSSNNSLIFESLEIRNLCFRYTESSPYVLNGLSLSMEKGKSYSLIGQNGAGKSTLTKILLGLYRDFEGKILINGIDISEYTTGELRRIFSVVYQDFAKYYIPLKNNIEFGNVQGDLSSALKLAELEDVVVKLPKKENTPLSKIYEDGVDISGGEWQKIAIARALYANAAFMILDEPTASLSPMMESKLYKRFGEITKDKTSLLISHRLGSTKLSDLLFVLDNGRVAETGTHDKLMAAKGIYADMFLNQRSWYDER